MVLVCRPGSRMKGFFGGEFGKRKVEIRGRSKAEESREEVREGMC